MVLGVVDGTRRAAKRGEAARNRGLQTAGSSPAASLQDGGQALYHATQHSQQVFNFLFIQLINNQLKF